jgi:uncharacterized protein with HEPN domain
MREEARVVSDFIAGVEYEAFLGNEILKRAVAQTLANIGELGRSLNDETKAQYQDVPWKAIRSTRNVIVHDYEEVDFSVIWQTVTESIPELIAAVNQIESDLGEELFGASDREKNRQTFLRALEEADAQNDEG